MEVTNMKFEWSTVAMFGIVTAAAVVMAVMKLMSVSEAVSLISGFGGGALLKQMVSKPVDNSPQP
jgi:hypothetical protein